MILALPKPVPQRDRQHLDPQRSIRRHLMASAVVMSLLVFGVGGWATLTEFSGAVVANGVVVVDTDVKKVQHPTGGVVAELRVRDGDRVHAGDLLARLDDIVPKSNLEVVVKGLDEMTARRARLEAERDMAPAIGFPRELAARSSDPEVARVMTGEKRLFEFRRRSREGQKLQYNEQIGQLREEIGGYTVQIGTKDQEVQFVTKELDGVRELYRKSLIPISRLTALERDAARIRGERGQLTAAIAQTKGKISEIELKIIQIDQDLRSDVSKELRETEAKIAELVERRITAADQLNRIDIRSPQDGIVHELDVHTIGGVIQQGNPIMLIVPTEDSLAVECRIPPHEIDQVHIDQNAIMRLTAFNARTTPEINGEVTLVSADVTTDQKSGQNYFTVRIRLSPSEVARLGRVKVVPGMPVEAFIQTTPRTVLSYLTKPLADQMTRSFREK